MTQLETEQGVVKVPAGTWKADPAHSSVAFEVRHMMISTVRGLFSVFDGTLEAAEDPEQSRAHGWSTSPRSTRGTPTATPTCAARSSSTSCASRG